MFGFSSHSRKTVDFPAPGAPLATLARFARYLWPRGDAAMRRRVVFACALLIAQKIAAITVPLIYGAAVDLVGAESFAVTALIGVLGGYALARLLQQICDELKHLFFVRVAQRAIRSLSLATFRHLHSLSMRFHLDRQTGRLSRVIERGGKSIEIFLTFAIFNIVPTAVEIALVCGMFWFLFDWRYAAVAFVSIGGYAVYTVAVTEWRTRFRRMMNEADQEANTHAIDSLLNYETVKYFGAEAREARRFEESLAAYEDAAVKSRVSLSFLNLGQGVFVAGGLLLITIMAGLDAHAGKITVGDFVVANTYLIQLYLPLNFLGSVYRELRRALVDMEDMFRLLAEKPDVPDAGEIELRPRAGRIEFRDVRFSYGRGEILRGVSFAAARGDKIAIVGESGAGKSTVGRLLFRFYDPDAGAILLEGIDARELTVRSLRAAVGVVPQDTVLFNDTIFANIAYADPAASKETVEEAAREAAIHDFVASLPEGYDTIVGERGLKLSGGEKQRVAIARALLKNPAALIFDEATSALDSRTEKEIQSALDQLAQSRTTIVIAHRLSTIVDADEILVMAHGEIVERGRHAHLLARDGLYAAMWRRQQSAPAAKAHASAQADDPAQADAVIGAAGAV